jgi:hypothetical protein
MRMLSVIGAAGAIFAAATVGFAQSQAPEPIGHGCVGNGISAEPNEVTDN